MSPSKTRLNVRSARDTIKSREFPVGIEGTLHCPGPALSRVAEPWSDPGNGAHRCIELAAAPPICRMASVAEDRPPTIRDVARAARVHHATVSRALRNDPESPRIRGGESIRR